MFWRCWQRRCWNSRGCVDEQKILEAGDVKKDRLIVQEEFGKQREILAEQLSRIISFMS